MVVVATRAGTVGAEGHFFDRRRGCNGASRGRRPSLQQFQFCMQDARLPTSAVGSCVIAKFKPHYNM